MLSDNIKKIRKKKGLSQDKLAKLADITHTTLVKIESGVNDNPTIKTLKKIADALEVTLDELVS
ncbi:MAG: helix-turn-helix transcriptional regulator [Actinobacteria bacterium]|nr:helix-turn-helix transcriptional regulator [Actinomycetota bacterium]MBL7197292.1 helix-turn-helix transcriptional regulator [Candidatus Omnitrophota bacterium]